MAYCTADEIREAGAQIGTGTFSNDYLNAVIERCSRYFDHLCGVEDEFFEAAGESATVKTIYGDGSPYLQLPPYVVLSEAQPLVTVPEGYTAPSFVERDGYLILEGTNGSLLTRSALGHSHDSGWWDGLPITITARWGYEATPADVKMAVIEMVINVLRETDPANLNLLDLERQPLREKVPPRVDQVAQFYRAQGAVLV